MYLQRQGDNTTGVTLIELPVVRRRAFTLIELLVVVVIIALAAGIAIPYAIGTSDLEVLSAARMLSCDLQFAQDAAVTSQQPVTVVFDTTDDSYSLRNASGLLIHPMTKAEYVVDFSSMRGFENIKVVLASFGGATQLTFDELGSPDNAGTIRLQSGAHVYWVAVSSATGRVTVTAGG